MDKIVLITGVFGGIGYATARLFHNKGWKVIGVDKEAREDQENIVDEFMCKDISCKEEVKEVFIQIKEEYDRLDCLVNNAAIQICKSIQETIEEEWDKTFASNIKSIFLTVKYAYDLLKKVKGSIVNVSSVHAMATSKNISAYAATKGAILTFTKSIALEFSEVGIRANVVLPGAVDTEMLRDGLSREHMSGEDISHQVNNLGLKHPVGRIGKPEEIAQAIYFLADNTKSSFMTGQSLVVDGGALVQLSTET